MKNAVFGKDIINFLQKMKKLLSDGSFLLADRKKNLDSLAQYGFTINDLKNALFELCVREYYAGPESDDDYSQGEIWAFIKKIDGINFYIKLKLEETESEEIIVCISFHESKRGKTS